MKPPAGKALAKPARQSGDDSLTPPCQAKCPLRMDIREYVDLVAQGRVMEALHVIKDDNPFPSLCAYVCTHPCEDACRRGQVDKPVAIRALKRFAIEFGGYGIATTESQTIHQERVAIVGSGPAGMACAYYLRKLGYRVIIFEAHAEAGGMLRLGIPQYRLPAEVLDAEVRRLTQMGVEIRCNTPAVSLDLLFELGYEAVFVATGAHQGRKLRIPGADLKGTLVGVSFLRDVHLGRKVGIGDAVVVLGGGNVAFDCARTARRLGARYVQIACLEPRHKMLADPLEIAQAEEEGISVYPSRTFLRVVEKEGRAAGVECLQVTSFEFDKQGKLHLDTTPGSEHVLPAETVIFAIGQDPDLSLFSPPNRPEGARPKRIEIDRDTLSTPYPGVFAGGDVVTGTASATQALAAGRLAALRIDDYLRHRYPLAERSGGESPLGSLRPESIEAIRKTRRLEPPALSPEARLNGFAPVEAVYDWETAINEARRCLRCGVGAQVLFQNKCAACLTCLKVCPYHVPYLDSNGAIQIPADQCLACGICAAHCPAKAIALRKPYERRHIREELAHLLKQAQDSGTTPLLVGFCCQYGLYGTGSLAGLWRGAGAGVFILPVLCVAKVESEHILRAFESGAEGVFIAGCGQQCARENTALWVQRRAARVKKTLRQLGLDPERLQLFTAGNGGDLAGQLDAFAASIGALRLASVIIEEARR